MSIEREKIHEVQGKIANSDLRESHKDAINDMLMTAGRATNGVTDKQQALTEALASLAICFARDALYRREDFRALMNEALDRHTANCPLAGAVGRDGRDSRDGVTISGKGGKATIPQRLYLATIGAIVFLTVIATVWKAKGWSLI